MKTIGLRIAKDNNVINNGNSHDNNNKDKEREGGENNYKRYTITMHSFRRFFKTQVSFEAKEPDLSEFLLGHKSLSQTYFKLSPANVAKTYLNSVMEHLTFCDMASVEKAKEELTQQLIEEREAKDRELRELKKRLSAYESKLDSVVNRIGDILGYADPLKQKEYMEDVKSIQNQ
jgi:hypothetical protein